MNKDCFAFVKKEECFALKKQNCENCPFFKTRKEAKEQYMQHRINDYEIDKYFMNL